MSYLIATESFPTKREISDRCRAILAVTPDGVNVGEKDVPFLFALFQFHDEWNQKAIGGVVNITTQTTPHGTRCFVLVKLSGEKVDISFPHAIRLIPQSSLSNASSSGASRFQKCRAGPGNSDSWISDSLAQPQAA